MAQLRQPDQRRAPERAPADRAGDDHRRWNQWPAPRTPCILDAQEQDKDWHQEVAAQVSACSGRDELCDEPSHRAWQAGENQLFDSRSQQGVVGINLL